MADKQRDELLILWRKGWIAWAKKHEKQEMDLNDSINSWRTSRKEGGAYWEAVRRQILRRAKEEGIEPAEFVERLFSHESSREMMSCFRGD